MATNDNSRGMLGSPTGDTPERNIRFELRLSPEEFVLLRTMAQVRGISAADVVRGALRKDAETDQVIAAFLKRVESSSPVIRIKKG